MSRDGKKHIHISFLISLAELGKTSGTFGSSWSLELKVLPFDNGCSQHFIRWRLRGKRVIVTDMCGKETGREMFDDETTVGLIVTDQREKGGIKGWRRT